MADLTALIDTYCAAWSEPDPDRRRALLSEVWADGATYTDPTVHAAGLDALLAHIDGVLSARPGTRVVRVSRVDDHHGLARFAWRLIFPDGTALPDGLDFAEVGADGRLTRIVGFFGPLGDLSEPDRPAQAG
ncbi:nuclear transport factor 2 family protein [Nonomuraea sp. NPDC050310]|uniref:nuclear transport factor 2 family protein n=1 Tax=Nonomuraea sp. NPDC050310 TaxID=3154935 RepID=UPI0033C25D2C